MRRALIVSMVVLGFTGSVYAAAVDISKDNLAKASQLSQALVAATQVEAVIDKAARIGVLVEGPGGQTQRGTLLLQPSDPEWKHVISAVKTANARKREEAKKGLDAIGVNVTP